MNFFRILIISSMIALFTGCGGGGSGSNETTLTNNITPQTAAIDIIIAYADDNSQPSPTVGDYSDAGIIGVNADNLINVNIAIDALIGTDVDTIAEIQAVVDEVIATLAAQAASDTVLSQIGLEADDPDSVNSIVTVTQLGAILPALTDINSTNEIAYQDYIDANPDSFASPATSEEVQAMIDTVNEAQAAFAAAIVVSDSILAQIGSEGDTEDTTNSIITVAQLEDILGLTDVVAANEIAYQDYIDANPDQFSDPATLSEVQAMIHTVNAEEALDTTPPVITLNGNNNITMYLGRLYIESGATAIDDRDGNVTEDIIIEGTVDTRTAGVYTVTYSVSDSNGNQSSVIRTVNVVNLFTRNDSTGIVTNNETGLQWRDNFNKNVWDNAVVLCGASGWRLPTTAEFRSINGIHLSNFESLVSDNYWTSEELASFDFYVYYVRVSPGSIETGLTSGKNSFFPFMCVKEGSVNTIPIANAGTDQNVTTASTVTLDGSLSGDVELNNLTYTWSITSKPEGSSVTLSDPTVVNPTFTVDVDGVYVLSLIVNNGTVDSIADTVTINATNTYIDLNNNIQWADANQIVGTTAEAFNYCSSLVIGPYSDWRVPASSHFPSTIPNELNLENVKYWTANSQTTFYVGIPSFSVTLFYFVEYVSNKINRIDTANKDSNLKIICVRNLD